MRKSEATSTKELPIHSVCARHHRPCPTICGCLLALVLCVVYSEGELSIDACM